MDSMAKFVEPAKEVDAIQYTRQPGGTLDDVFAFAAKASRYVISAMEETCLDFNGVTTHRLWVADRSVNIGSWLIFGAEENYDYAKVMTDKDFRAKYKPVEVVKCKSPEPAIIGGPGSVNFVLDSKDGWIAPDHAR